MAAGWQDIRAEVLGRIRDRRWPPGGLIPTEQALAVEFACARATVNRALRDLAEQGVLERRRKAGTRVASLPVRRATLNIPVIRQEVEATGQTYRHSLLARGMVQPPVPVASRLGLQAGVEMLYLETLHLADGRPHVFETRWLNPAILPDPAPDFAVISANEWLVAHVTYTTGDIAFSAAAANQAEADALGLPAGAALFITERCTWGPVHPITLVHLAHRPGYRLHTML